MGLQQRIGSPFRKQNYEVGMVRHDHGDSLEIIINEHFVKILSMA